MKNISFAIAIDGPVGAGKGTVAELLAQKLHGFHLNTGAMYRCLALYCLEKKIDPTNGSLVIAAMHDIVISLSDHSVIMNGEDVGEKIKAREVTQIVPVVAAIAAVRKEMVKRQREIGLEKIGEGKIVLVDGRDGATRIFPDAALKVFLTAAPEVRAKRRFDQMDGSISLEQILEDTKERDYKDTHREADPLVSDPDSYGYTIVDNSHLSENETIELILQKLEKIYDTH